MAACALALAAACAPAPRLERVEREAQAMGTTFGVIVYAADRAAGERAAELALARVRELDAILSDYDAASELSRLSASSRGDAAGEPVALGADLYAVLARAQSIARASDGAFDVTLGPCTDLWRRAARQEELPAPERLAAARAASGHARLVLDADARTARLLARDMRLDLGGIGKGYACDEALAVLERAGFPRALVRGGGDVRAGAPPPGRDGWRVALAPLDDRAEDEWIELARAAVSTSGDRVRFVTIDGVRYSHVIDPATGLGATRRVAASVVAPDGALADALATAACALGPERALALVEEQGAQARVLVLENGAWRTCETAGWGRF